jgi:hypothetical protein
MKKNMGSTDKIIRLVIAAVIAGLYFGKVVDGTLALILLVVAIIFAATSLLNFCPLYSIFGLNTCKVKDKK